MIGLFQNMIALSVQMGILIAFVVFFCKVMKKPYCIKGRYYLWLIIAVRLLIPINMEWIQIEDYIGAKNVFIQKEEEQPSHSGEEKTAQKPQVISEKPQSDISEEYIDDTKVSIEQKENESKKITSSHKKKQKSVAGKIQYFNRKK